MKQLVCIVCPIGCRVCAEEKDGQFIISGNRCKRGAEFAETELTAPMRSVCTTVRTIFDDVPVLPVRTKCEIPKKLIPELIHALAAVVISQRIGIGETVLENFLGTGCDVVATSNMLKSTGKKEDAHDKSTGTDD